MCIYLAIVHKHLFDPNQQPQAWFPERTQIWCISSISEGLGGFRSCHLWIISQEGESSHHSIWIQMDEALLSGLFCSFVAYVFHGGHVPNTSCSLIWSDGLLVSWLIILFGCILITLCWCGQFRSDMNHKSQFPQDFVTSNLYDLCSF